MSELQAAIHRQNQTVIDIPGYKIERTLGKGGMASVYLAIQESFEREVALKVMSPSLSEDSKFSERFLREAKIVSRLVHPNIVTVYDVGVHNQQHYLSMEYIPGDDLKHKRKQLPLKECLQVVSDVARALDYASKKGYVHRDVKPENIMLHEDDSRAVLMDFGIACLSDTASGMTQTGTAIGTPHYMSPEQAKGRAVDPRSDIYSLGVVLFLLVTGHVPFDADSAVAVGIKHVSAKIPRLAKCYALLQPIIDKVLAKEPSERFQNGKELIEALEQITDEDIKAIELLSTRSFAAVGDDAQSDKTPVDKTSGASPSVRSQAQPAVKAEIKNNPNLTTVSAAALNTKSTETIADRSGVSKVVGKTPVTGSQRTAGSGQKKTTASKQRALSGKTPISGVNKAVRSTTGKNSSVASPTTGKQTVVSRKTGSQKTVSQRTGSVKKVPNKTAEQVALLQKTGAQAVASTRTGKQAKVSEKSLLKDALSETTGESLFVDEEDRREHAIEPDKKSIWPKAVAVSLIIAAAGSLYFREYFPPTISQPLDSIVASGVTTKNNLFQQMGWSAPSVPTETVVNASIESPQVSPVPETEQVSETENVDEEGFSSDSIESVVAAVKEDQGAMGQARSLREGMKSDLSLAPQLAQLYRDILSESPDMKNAEWGLRDVREFHERFIRDSFQVRDLATTKRYMASLDASFPGEMATDEKHQVMLARVAMAEQAQTHIDSASAFLQSDALSSPKGANALESYRQALALDPKNPLAVEGLEKIVQRYVELGRESFEKGNLNDALQSASRGLAINNNNDALIKLREDASQVLERRSKTNALLLAAREQLDKGNLIEPKADSAFDRYKELLSFDRGNDDAQAGLREVERQLAFRIEAYINRNQFDLASDLINRTSELYPGSNRMEDLSLTLATAKEADFIARQPKIAQLLVSETTPTSINEPQKETINVERTIHIGFSFANFVAETSVVNAVLWDGSRTVEIKAVPVIVSGKDGVKFFQIDRPVEGFSEGGYNIDFFLGETKLHSKAFKVAKQ